MYSPAHTRDTCFIVALRAPTHLHISVAVLIPPPHLHISVTCLPPTHLHTSLSLLAPHTPTHSCGHTHTLDTYTLVWLSSHLVWLSSHPPHLHSSAALLAPHTPTHQSREERFAANLRACLLHWEPSSSLHPHPSLSTRQAVAADPSAVVIPSPGPWNRFSSLWHVKIQSLPLAPYPERPPTLAALLGTGRQALATPVGRGKRGGPWSISQFPSGVCVPG